MLWKIRDKRPVGFDDYFIMKLISKNYVDKIWILRKKKKNSFLSPG